MIKSFPRNDGKAVIVSGDVSSGIHHEDLVTADKSGEQLFRADVWRQIIIYM